MTFRLDAACDAVSRRRWSGGVLAGHYPMWRRYYMNGKSLGSLHRGKFVRRKGLPRAIGLVFAGPALAQSTCGTICGTVPAANVEVILVTGGAGFNRSVE